MLAVLFLGSTALFVVAYFVYGGFVERRLVDRHGGEWFWRVSGDGSVDRSEPKVSEWKGPYHTVRMCLEMMGRISSGSKGS